MNKLYLNELNGESTFAHTTSTYDDELVVLTVLDVIRVYRHFD